MKFDKLEWRAFGWASLLTIFELGALSQLPSAIAAMTEAQQKNPISLILFFALSIGRIALGVVVNRETSNLQLTREAQFKEMARQKLNSSSVESFSKLPPGRWLGLLDQDAEDYGAFAMARIQLSVNFLLSLGYMALAFWLSPLATGAALVVGLTATLLSRKIQQRILFWSEVSRRTRQSWHELLVDEILGHGTFKSPNWRRQRDTLHSHRSRHWLKSLMKRDFWRHLSPAVMESLWLLLLATLIGVATASLTNITTLIAFVAVFQRLYQKLAATLESFSAILELTPTIESHLALQSTLKSQFKTYSHSEPSWQLQNVEFSYQYPVLKDFSLRITPGEWILVSGPNGVGKSTAAKILAGILKAQRGNVIHPEASSTVYVSDTDHLFLEDHGFENLVENLEWCARQRQLFSLDSNELQQILSQGGFRAQKLSAGQRQKYLLMRALLAQPDLLIIDEALSTFDTQAEKQFLSQLKIHYPKMSVVLISHRQISAHEFHQSIKLGKPTSKFAHASLLLGLLCCLMLPMEARAQTNKGTHWEIAPIGGPILPGNITGFHEIIQVGGLQINRGISDFRPQLTVLAGNAHGSSIQQVYASVKNELRVMELEGFKPVWFVGLQATRYRRPPQGSTVFPYFQGSGFHLGFGIESPINKTVAIATNFVLCNGPGRILAVNIGLVFPFGDEDKSGSDNADNPSP